MEFCEKSKGPASNPVTGASVSTLNDLVTVTGGFQENDMDLYLKIRCFNLLSASWIPSFVNSNGIRNRYFHASAAIKNKVYIFGGCIPAENNHKPILETSKDIIVINKTIFGIETSIHSENVNSSRQGLTASVVGENLDKAVLFGGFESQSNGTKTYSSDVWIFSGEDDLTLKPVEVDKTGERPANRAFHSAAVCGDQNQYLLMYGGHNEHKTPLSDLWLLDLTEIINAEDKKEVVAAPVIVDPKAKPAKKEKDAPAVKVPTAYWTRILVDSVQCVPRYLHNSFAVSVNEEIKFVVFGGVSTTGPLPMNDLLEMSVAKNAQTGKYAALSADFNLQTKKATGVRRQHPDNPENYTSYGSATAVIPASFAANSSGSPTGRQGMTSAHGSTTNLSTAAISSASPALVVVLGGCRGYVQTAKQSGAVIRAPVESITYMIVTDEQSKLVKRVRKAVRKNNQSSMIVSSDGEDESKAPNMQTINFPNGDIYEGEVGYPRGVSPEDDDASLPPEQSVFDEATGELVLEQDGGNDPFPHGRGSMRYISGDVYEGQWVNGLRHGDGQFTSAEGTVYTGQFTDDHQTGHGQITTPDGLSYVGSVQDGIFHGAGQLTYTDGNVFSGCFEYGSREGEGSLYCAADQSNMTGVWEHDELKGAGFVTNMQIQSLNTILSHTVNPALGKATMAASMRMSQLQGGIANTMAGETMTSRTALSKGFYTGPVIDGVPYGESGVAVYQDGSEYNGAWRSGRRNGVGQYIFPNQDEYRGKWVGDRRCGYGILRSALNPNYEGQWEDNLPHGQGQLTLRDGRVYSGDFVAGKCCGEGKLLASVESESILFEGTWSNNSPVPASRK